jgi:hypothetical protein
MIEPALRELIQLREVFPKLYLPARVVAGNRNYLSHRANAFSHERLSLNPDLKSRIMPCQFGGKPD